MWDKSVLESIPINNLHDERKIQDSSLCHKGESKISLANLVMANVSI